MTTEKGNCSARYWNRWRKEQPEGENEKWTHWWTCPLLIRRFYHRGLGFEIQEEKDFFTRVKEKLSLPENIRALSLCGGTGDLERRLIHYGFLCGADIVEISSEAAQVGVERAKVEGAEISYCIMDANKGDFGQEKYPLVLANSAIHHLEDLQNVVEGIYRALLPGGLILAQEYVGPDRFQWEPEWIRAATSLLRSLPENLRKGSDDRAEDYPWIPTEDEVCQKDPTEAVCSSAILPTLENRFETRLCRNLGGNFYQMLFPLILPGLDPANPCHVSLVRMICSVEDLLLDRVGWNSHFVLYAGEKR